MANLEKQREASRRWREKNPKFTSKWRRTPSGLYSAYKCSAKSKFLSFTLTKQQFISLARLPCTYCGEFIEPGGLDRVDSSLGYTLNNVVSCCSQCNTMKMDYSTSEFLSKVARIYHNIGRSVS